MRAAGWITVILVLLSCYGCSAGRETTISLRPATPVLLFDVLPGWPTAAEMASRSPWPATPSYFAAGEDVFYRERFTDVQTGGQGSGRPRNYVYRRFDTYRVGRGQR